MMRLSLLFLLLLTAATITPVSALAQRVADHPAEAARAPEPRSEPPPRTMRPFGRGEDAPRVRAAERAERMERAVEVAQPPSRPERIGRSDRPLPREVRVAPAEAVAGVPAPEVRQWRGGRGAVSRPGAIAGGEGWRERGGERRGRARDIPPPAGSPVYGWAVPSPVTVTRGPSEVSPGSVAAEGLGRNRIDSDKWRRDWRGDRRYDWRRYRDRDRSRFQLGIYIDPFGRNRRDYEIGWRLPSRYYGVRYWIADPWYYRLPPVGGPCRWIRYHDDVLLVDLRSGRVLDRIRNFFW